jgi:hypothetical protein
MNKDGLEFGLAALFGAVMETSPLWQKKILLTCVAVILILKEEDGFFHRVEKRYGGTYGSINAPFT